MKKQFVNNRDSFTFICNYCGSSRTIPIKTKVISIDIRCNTCDQITPVRLCYRKHFRKQTNITGELVFKNNTYPVNINNISLTGYQLSSIKNFNIDIRVDDVCKLKYQLTNKKKTDVSETIVIKTVDSKNQLYGAMVTDSQPYSKIQKAKGFWLMP